MARLWDVKSGELLGSFKGHLCSLKSVAFTPEEKGNISPTQTQHVLRVKAYIVYKIEEKAGFHKYKQLLVFMKNVAWLILIISSVFCLIAVFCTGARDGNIMVWDTRCSKKGIYFTLN